jgi:hypothetical protein
MDLQMKAVLLPYRVACSVLARYSLEQMANPKGEDGKTPVYPLALTQT